VKLRRAAAKDLQAVEDLTRRAYEHYIPIIGAKPMPMTEDYAPRIAAGEVWLLEDATGAAGLIVLEECDGELLIYSVAVEPQHQHSGLGRKLLAFAEATARERGFPTLALFTNAKMERNIGIYRRLGFIETRRRAHATRADTVVVDMQKKLGAAENRRSA
jgi:ribosomal protein S18 acetylase RimI-like enzyme